MLNVAVTDRTFPDLDVERSILEPLGCRVEEPTSHARADLITLTTSADYVITQFAPLDASIIDAMQQARGIVRYGVGVDNVDLETARRRNIPVCNVPDYCIDEVADHTLALLLNATRQLSVHDRIVRNGQWCLTSDIKKIYSLVGVTVGIVGFGRIGREVARRLAAFKCRVLVADPFADIADVRNNQLDVVSLDRLLNESDIVTLHCPSTEATRHLINSASLSQMRRGVILINVGRGALIDTQALLTALRSGHISAAGLDVTDPEPLPPEHELRQMEQVAITPHIASISSAAVRKLRETVVGMIARHIQGQPWANVVNGVGVPASHNRPPP